MAALEQISPRQLDYLNGLCRERDTDLLTGRQCDWLDSYEFRRLNRVQASRVITALLALPKLTDDASKREDVTKRTAWPDVDAGRYAVVDPEDQVLKFYKVDRPAVGSWAGRVFLSVQASDELYPIKAAAKREQIMAIIAEDPKSAMLRYGQELGHCGHCGRTLTNEVSRKYGIGPVCRAKMGW